MRPAGPIKMCPLVVNFNPRTPYGVRRRISGSGTQCKYFNPRTPYGVRQRTEAGYWSEWFISIHALHTECDDNSIYGIGRVRISIHALHTECDVLLKALFQQVGISIHALHTECDFLSKITLHHLFYFNPRTPYGVRPGSTPYSSQTAYFNPRTPYGVRRDDHDRPIFLRDFNPRTPYGVRLGVTDQVVRFAVFQSTHSIRSATDTQCRTGKLRAISIHALHTECDAEHKEYEKWVEISIHALHTECDDFGSQTHFRQIISIHALHTECDDFGSQTHFRQIISIHALHTECDFIQNRFHLTVINFNPRTPYGVRPSAGPIFVWADDISIHALHTECDDK